MITEERVFVAGAGPVGLVAAAALGSGAEPADFAAARARSGVAGRFAGSGSSSSSTAADSRATGGAAARGTASFCVTAAPGSRPGDARITLEITVAQLETLLVLLGQEPAGSPREMAEQLLSCL